MIDAETAAIVEQIRAEYPGCFACGVDNPVGLHLAPSAMEGHEAVASYRPIRHHGGAGEILHGGLAATALDEIMVWAGILAHRVLTITATMDLRFRRPVAVTDDLEVRGRVEKRTGRRLRCTAELLVDGDQAVTANGLYLVARSFEGGEGVSAGSAP